MTENMRDQVIQLADKYCQLNNVTRYDLFQKGKHKGSKKKKVVNGANVATIRMALGYYFTLYFPMSLVEIAGLIGYSDHSSISTNNKKIRYYIKNNDKYFMYYYNLLQDLGSFYTPMILIQRNKSQLKS
jgi:chromosomal replication initiation ATPase DnaA